MLLGAPLPAGAVAVLTSWPAAGPALAFLRLLLCPPNAALSGGLLLGILDPPLADQFYGERGGRLRDPFGQQWMLSQRIEQLSREEMERRAASFFSSAD